MIARHEVLLSIYGAWRLFLRDPRGIEWLDDSVDGFWKSFFCAVLVLPVFMLWVMLAELDAGFLRIVTVEGIAYVIHWVAWPLAMAYLAPAIDRDRNYIRYIVAFNWSSAIVAVILILLLTIEQAGLATGNLLILISLIARAIMLSYHWYVARIALEVSGIGAAGLVIAEFVLGQIINAVSLGMLR